MTEEWTEYEQAAILAVLQKALDDNTVPPEQRAAVVRGKQRIEKVAVRRSAVGIRSKEAKYFRWE